MLTADRSGALPPIRAGKALLLNCFGRCGSSIVRNIVGSLPDVLTPACEWHEGCSDVLTSCARLRAMLAGAVNWASVLSSWQHMRAATAETVLPGTAMKKPQARFPGLFGYADDIFDPLYGLAEGDAAKNVPPFSRLPT
jgi:hypothetical protein